MMETSQLSYLVTGRMIDMFEETADLIIKMSIEPHFQLMGHTIITSNE